jgi:hypothetical protein
MTAREKLLETIHRTPEPLLAEVLHYLEYLLERHLEEQEENEDLEELKVIRQEIAKEGTVPWNQVKQELGL